MERPPEFIFHPDVVDVQDGYRSPGAREIRVREHGRDVAVGSVVAVPVEGGGIPIARDRRVHRRRVRRDRRARGAVRNEHAEARRREVRRREAPVLRTVKSCARTGVVQIQTDGLA